MSFELVDNYVQVLVMGVSALTALGAGFYYRDRRCVVLTFLYACFGMGTLFYVLHLLIMGVTPKVFYVSEISWLASYLFLLLLQLLRTEKMDVSFSLLPFVCAVLTGGIVLADRIMGPSYLMSGLFAVTTGAIIYFTVYRLQHTGRYRKTDILIIICLVLQISLFISSDFIREYSRFNLYFAIDLALTGNLAVLLFMNMQEIREDRNALHKIHNCPESHE